MFDVKNITLYYRWILRKTRDFLLSDKFREDFRLYVSDRIQGSVAIEEHPQRCNLDVRFAG